METLFLLIFFVYFGTDVFALKSYKMLNTFTYQETSLLIKGNLSVEQMEI